VEGPAGGDLVGVGDRPDVQPETDVVERSAAGAHRLRRAHRSVDVLVGPVPDEVGGDDLLGDLEVAGPQLLEPAPVQRGAAPVRQLVPRLVDRQVGAARQADRGEQPPALVAHRAGHLHALGAQLVEHPLEVVAHQVQLVAGLFLGRVHGDLGRWQPEDQPAATRVDAREPERVPNEAAVRLRVAAVQQHVCTVDHASPKDGRIGCHSYAA
jgi:hypothetical protein